MNSKHLGALAALGLLFVGTTAGCKDAEQAPADPAPATKGARAEGLCEEHGVLEVVCTKCNPKLAKVFQQKGDFCEEHGFAESFCPVCHPERGGRPDVDVSTDEAPADGTKVKFASAEVADAIGIETVRAEAGLARTELQAPVRIAYDATKLAQLNARAPGVVSSLSVDVGSTVEKGDALLSIESPEVGAQRARLAAAASAVDLARQEVERKYALAKEGLVPEKDVAFAKNDLAKAESEQAAILASLSVMGGGGGGGGYALTAPIAGVVTARSATIGKMVELDEVLVEIVDTSSVWAELDIPETELSAVARGQDVSLLFPALGDEPQVGTIDYIAPAIDRHTRTARARVPLQNPTGDLRAEMFGEATIAIDGATSVLVPQAAIQRAKSVKVAFVKLADDEYEMRRVKLGVRVGERIEVRSGIEPGEEVVTTASFLLKTETLKDSIGAGCCEVD